VEMPTITPQMRQYSHIGYWLYLVVYLYAISLSLFLLCSGLNTSMRNWVEALTSKPVLQFLIYYFCLSLFFSLATFPPAIAADFLLDHHFHLSDQSFGDWLVDCIKGDAMSFVLGIPTCGGYYWLVRKFRKLWPILFCALICIWSVIASFISPVVLEPVFNKFTVMAPSPLKTKIEELSNKAGFPNLPIYIADKSKQTRKFNAYVSGIGTSSHIVIYDTTIGKLPDDQLLAMIGHELGHKALGHVYIDFLISVVCNLFLIPVNMFVVPFVVARLPRRWGIRSIRDYALIPAMMLGSCIFGIFLDPIGNSWSRTHEHEADAYSKKLTGNGPALARLCVTFSEQNLSEPDPPPIIEFWLFSHPSLENRIKFALTPNESEAGEKRNCE
jgi:STE24 endopeptidase